MNIIEKPEFTSMLPENVDLKDLVYCYHDNHKWKVVNLKILERYPLIYDKTLEGEEITFTYCPYARSGIVYWGRWTSQGKLYKDANIILNDTTNSYHQMIQLKGVKYDNQDKKLIDAYVRKKEARLMTLRNALSTYPDFLYLDFNVRSADIIYENKSIEFGYGIEYISSEKEYSKKYSLLILHQNMLELVAKYIENYADQLTEKGGFEIPVLQKNWRIVFPESKDIKIDQKEYSKLKRIDNLRRLRN